MWLLRSAKIKVLGRFRIGSRKTFEASSLDNEIAHAKKLVIQAVNDKSENRPKSMLKAADALCRIMERQSIQIRDLVLALPPVKLLAYIWSFRYLNVLYDAQEKSESDMSDKEIYQFVLEYIHAVWSCHAKLADENIDLDEAKVAVLMEALEAFMHTTMHYCLTSSAAREGSKGNRQWSDLEFQVKSGWVLMRGRRYQMLEEEFFMFVLKPHARALQTAYGMKPGEIATGVQGIANALRAGHDEASQKLHNNMDKGDALSGETCDDLVVAEGKSGESGDLTADTMGAVRDLLFGGVCSLSRHTNFTSPLLEDISYLPGENTEFFAAGSFKGTPMRTLPSLIKPGIKLGDEYYVTDGQWVRDSMYRAIQRGLIRRLPEYSEEWNRSQKSLIEKSFPEILDRQFAQASIYSEVFFKDPTTDQWVETDLVMVVDDVLLMVEAKAGVMAMHSPATDFYRHERVIRNLIVKAYEQCKRFIKYLATDVEVSLHGKRGDKYVEIGRLQRGSYRAILPIGLTVESYDPVATMSKGLAELRPLLGKYPFISMSVDNLFILNRFFPTTGELFHYLEVRQKVAGLPDAVLFDEVDHLGAYIEDSRFNIRNIEQLRGAGRTMCGSSGVVDKHFRGDTWMTASAPSRKYSKPLAAVLKALDKLRPSGWLEMDSYIRDLSDNGKSDLTTFLTRSKATLRNTPVLHFLVDDDLPLQVWLCRSGAEPLSKAMRDKGEAFCLNSSVPRVLALRISRNKKGKLTSLACASYYASGRRL